MIRPGSKIYRWVWLSVTWLALGLAAAGAVLPVMPTTPFLLVALWAGSRASPRFRFWLFRHPRYGPALRAWHRHRAIPLRAKILAFALMTFSATILWLSGTDARIFYSVLAMFVAVGIFLISRPSHVEPQLEPDNDNRHARCPSQ